jgi:hypothetical protein
MFQIARLTAVLALAVALGSCAAQSTVTPTNPAMSSADRIASNPAAAKPLTSLTGEVLTGNKVQVDGCHGGATAFKASGSATGPDPGKFTLSGQWQPRSNGGTILTESFVIKSGKSSISGTVLGLADLYSCSRFPLTTDYAMTYTVGSSSARMTTTGISDGKLEETFN